MQLSIDCLESKAIPTDLSFFIVSTTGNTKQHFSTFYIFSKCPDWISLLILFSKCSCKWYGMDQAFCSNGWCFFFILILVFLTVRFVLNNFSNFIVNLSFSDWPVVVVLLSIFRIVHLNSCNQSIPSIGFLAPRSVIDIVEFLRIPLLSASTVIFPAIVTLFLLTSWCFRVIGEIFMTRNISLSVGNIVTGDAVTTMISSSVRSNFSVMIIWFNWSFTCFILVNKFIDLSVSPFFSLVEIRNLLNFFLFSAFESANFS